LPHLSAPAYAYLNEHEDPRGVRPARRPITVPSGGTMPGPYVINDVALLKSLPGEDAKIPASDAGFGVQCVGLVKYYSSAGPTKSWKQGDLVSESAQLATGTAIATFDKDGHYASKAYGNHACFFIAFLPSNKGITVLEQHVNPKPNEIQTRDIFYKGGKGDPCSDANAYSVIL
jgi:hypothetical protein